MAGVVCVTNKANQNLTPSQKYMIQWHFILVHIGFQHVKWLIRTGFLKVQGNYKAGDNCESPKCDSYEFGKGHFRSNNVNTTKNNPMKEQDIKKDYNMPR